MSQLVRPGSHPTHVNRRTSILAALSITAAASGVVTTAATAAAAPAPDRPNVLLITLDDAARGDFQYLPFTRQLIGEHGVTLDNLVAPTPLCTPSRASLLTGKYAHNHGVVTVGGPQGSAEYFASSGQNEDTLPVWLDDAGYETFQTGKWMNGYERPLPGSAAEPGWDRWEPTTVGTYNFFDTRFFVRGAEVGTRGRYSTYAITDRAEAFIAGQRDDDPWFAWVNYVAPHHGGPDAAGDPAGLTRTTVPAPEDRGRFDGVALRDQPNMWHGGRASRGKSLGRRVDARLRSDARVVFQQRIEALQAVDRGVRAQVEALARTGQLAETYVIVTSDNGYEVGEHNHVGKLLPYDDSLKVPTVIRGPGIPEDRVVHSVASVPDLAVTIAAIGGAEPPSSQVDGTNLLPMLSSPQTLGRSIPIEGWQLYAAGGERMFWGVVQDRWTYFVLKGRPELYDTVTDPFQVHNLAGRKRYVGKEKELRTLARSLRTCAGDSCPKEYVAAG